MLQSFLFGKLLLYLIQQSSIEIADRDLRGANARLRHEPVVPAADAGLLLLPGVCASVCMRMCM